MSLAGDHPVAARLFTMVGPGFDDNDHHYHGCADENKPTPW
jgi:hypothetical protein